VNAATAWTVMLVMVAIYVGLCLWWKPRPGMIVAGAVWLGFLIFWNVTAGQGGPRKSEETARSRALHQYLLNGGLLLMFVSIPGLRGRFLPPNPWHAPVGLALMAAATLFHIWARVHLGRNWTGQVTIKTDHQLVRSGPYRFIRHPIYTALVALALGTAIISARWLSLLGAAVFLVAYLRKLRIEETALSQTFAEWEEYRKKSWALVPGLY